MIALLDAVKRRELPEQLKCRQVINHIEESCYLGACKLIFGCCAKVFPTSGKRSTSLWDVDGGVALHT